jgi:CHAT domain-containing protein/tetratricopeptide (TPR) repeat protein
VALGTLAQSGVDSLLRHADSVYLRAPDSSTALFQIALDRAGASGDSSGVARSLTGLGQAARQAGEFRASRELSERALALKLRLGMRADLFRSYNALGLLAWAEGRLSDASAMFVKAAESARAINDSVALAKVQVNSGLVLNDLGDFEGGRAALVAGRDAARAAGDTGTLGRALNNLAALDITLGNPLPAVEGLGAARRLFRAAGDSIGEVNALGQVAAAYDALGEPQRAFATLDSALGMARRLAMRVEEAEDLKLLADLYRDAGYHQHALDVYARAAAMNDSLGKPEERGNLLRDEAQVYFALGGMMRATQLATEALGAHHAGGFRYPELADHLLLAELSQHAKQSADAETHLRSARALALALGASIASADVALSEARVADEAGQAERVLRVLEEFRGALAEAGSGASAEASALRARAYARLGRLDAAAVAGRQAVTAVERVRRNYGSGELRTSYASGRAAVYADLVVVLLRLGRTAEAFEVADAARGRGLLEHLATARSDARTAGSAGTLAEGEALLRRIDELMAKLQQREQTVPRERTPGYVATTNDLTDRLRRARTEYEEMLARRAQDDAASMALIGGGRADVHAVQASLEPGEILLEYFVTPARLFIFAVTPRGLTSFTSDVTAEDLAARVRLARDLMAGRATDDARTRRVLGSLHTIMLGPVAASLRGVRRIIVVSHSVLTYLPLAALVDTATGRYVAEDYAVAHVPSAAALPVLRAAGSREMHTARASAEVFAPFPEALPATRAEARSVRSSVPGAVAHVGGAATEGRLRSALASGAIVHVATHGVMNARNPLFSRLELATREGGASDDNGRLEVHELLDLHFQSPLVFLSGCETGLGASWSTQFETGQDYTTISQALLFAGARNVVATLWRIDDEGAAEFARRFYSARQTLGAPEALARAQREMIADPRWRGPYLWAAYEVSGGGIEGFRASKIR